MSPPTKVVLVTGASSGIGQAIALEFARSGHRVAVTGRSRARLEAVLEELYEESGARARSLARAELFLGLQVDFGDESQVDTVVERVVGHFGALNVLISNAGSMGENHDLLDEDFFADFQRVLQVNLVSAARLAQLAAPHLLKGTVAEPGILINVSSIADRVPLRAIGYCVSKAGLSMLTKVLANSLEGRHVRVLTVAPGPVSSNLVPDARVLEHMGERATLLHRPGYASEVAKLVAFLASNKASYMHGSTVDIDGGTIAKLGLLVTEGLAERLTR